jgi:hypothetical protein
LADTVAKLVAKTVEELAKTKKLDLAAITVAKTRFVAAATSMGVLPSMAFPKLLYMPVIYRGVVIKVSCSSYLDFFQVA